ncbi:MAG: substrate-binding domain-containing protein [Treponemataceae bacterium]
MKKIILCALTVIALFASCAGGTNREVRISGSSSVSPLMTKLAAGFEQQNGKYAIIVETTDSTIGVQDTIDGKNEIGMASREIKEQEGEKLDSKVLCMDGLALIVNQNAQISQITSNELIDIYMNNSPVMDISKAISREEGSGTRDAFASLTGIARREQLPQTVEILDGTGKVKSAVANDEAKIGYISLGAVDQSIKVLGYDGGTGAVVPSIENVQNGTYTLYRPFMLTTKKDATLSEGAAEFLNFITSPEGQKIILDNGFIPSN